MMMLKVVVARSYIPLTCSLDVPWGSSARLWAHYRPLSSQACVFIDLAEHLRSISNLSSTLPPPDHQIEKQKSNSLSKTAHVGGGKHDRTGIICPSEALQLTPSAPSYGSKSLMWMGRTGIILPSASADWHDLEGRFWSCRGGRSFLHFHLGGGRRRTPYTFCQLPAVTSS
jgi:hypothetical protein